MSAITTTLTPRVTRLHDCSETHALRDLIRVNLQSARALRQSASIIPDRVLRYRFLEVAAQRLKSAAELEEALAQQNGYGRPRFARLLATAAQRWWTRLRSGADLNRDADLGSIVSLAAQHEQVIDRAYRRALRDLAHTPAACTIQRQCEQAHRTQATITDLRDLIDE